MIDPTEPKTGARADRRAWLGLAVLGLPTMLLAVDMSVVYLALPRLSADLGATANEQLWIADIYGFVTAGFLVTMGTLGDRIGRRKLLLIGAAAFAAASVFAAYAETVAALIVARALMGLAGATLMPSTLALISTMFTDRSERATAIAVWTGCFMAGAAVGPIVGGALLQHFWWGSLFLLGLPVMFLVLVTGPFLLPEYKRDLVDGIDAPSVGLSLAAILLVISSIKSMAKDGITGLAIAAGLIGFLAGAVFVRRQRSLASPLLDLRLFRSRELCASLVIFTVGLAAQGGIVLLVSEHLQLVEGLSPLQAGWALMPASVAMVAICMLTPLLARWVQPGWVIGAGLVVATIGYLVLARIGVGADARPFVGAALLIFVGISPMAVLSQDLVIGSAPSQFAGSAAALSETSGDLGIALGVAIVGSISTAMYTRGLATLPAFLPASASAEARGSIAGAVKASATLPAPLSRALLQAARGAFTAGLDTAAMASAGVTFLLAILAVVMLRRSPPAERQAGIGGTSRT